MDGMKTVLVTGSKGFIGKNLIEGLGRRDDIKLLCFDADDDLAVLTTSLKAADIVYHLAGVNRPENVKDFETGNSGLTERIVTHLKELNMKTPVVMTSSTQVSLDNPYGVSKKKAEDVLVDYHYNTGANVYIYRLTNVFGKWSRPNYNSVVSTFCHNISHNLEITISDPERNLELVYIDDVVREFVAILDRLEEPVKEGTLSVSPTYNATLGELAKKIYQLRDIRKSLVIPDMSGNFMKCLYATYLSYLDKNDFSYPLEPRTDSRGSLFELLKSEHFGQVFMSTTHGGIIRGNHYHNSKIEKFCVVRGKAVVKFRHIFDDEMHSYHVSGEKPEIVDIPPGYTHSIENLLEEEMIVFFWANQIFDPINPDTYYKEV